MHLFKVMYNTLQQRAFRVLYLLIFHGDSTYTKYRFTPLPRNGSGGVSPEHPVFTILEGFGVELSGLNLGSGNFKSFPPDRVL